jgi:hypothetical protein
MKRLPTAVIESRIELFGFQNSLIHFVVVLAYDTTWIFQRNILLPSLEVKILFNRLQIVLFCKMFVVWGSIFRAWIAADLYFIPCMYWNLWFSDSHSCFIHMHHPQTNYLVCFFSRDWSVTMEVIHYLLSVCHWSRFYRAEMCDIIHDIW